MGTLFVVATPIGNLADISTRALQVLAEVNLVLAEDTRHTGIMLNRLGIRKPMLSYHRFNARAREAAILVALHEGDVALVSDAGTPAVSDPGAELVRSAIDAGFSVSPIPGPSAALAAWSIAGMPEGPFVTAGFLPRQRTKRQEMIMKLGRSGFAIVLFEAPGRTATTLEDLAVLIGDREATVSRELTKLHEETLRGSLTFLAQILREQPPRGEVVIVIGLPIADAQVVDPAETMRAALESGVKASDAAREVARQTGVPRSDLYRLALSMIDHPRPGNDEKR